MAFLIMQSVCSFLKKSKVHTQYKEKQKQCQTFFLPWNNSYQHVSEHYFTHNLSKNTHTWWSHFFNTIHVPYHLLKTWWIRCSGSWSDTFFKIPELFSRLSEVLHYYGLELSTSPGITFLLKKLFCSRLLPTLQARTSHIHWLFDVYVRLWLSRLNLAYI